MRTIDADALMTDLGKWLKQTDPTHPPEDNAIPPMEDIIVSTLMTIEEQPTIEPQRWIPVTEKLPEECEDIIVTYVDDEETRIIPVNYGKGTWYDCLFNTALNPINVVAWMKKPEPYKGGRNEL